MTLGVSYAQYMVVMDVKLTRMYFYLILLLELPLGIGKPFTSGHNCPLGARAPFPL